VGTKVLAFLRPGVSNSQIDYWSAWGSKQLSYWKSENSFDWLVKNIFVKICKVSYYLWKSFNDFQWQHSRVWNPCFSTWKLFLVFNLVWNWRLNNMSKLPLWSNSVSIYIYLQLQSWYPRFCSLQFRIHN